SGSARMRRALILFSCCAVLLFGGVADARVADDIDWHALPYFQWLNDTLKISTNEGWRGARKVSTGRFDPQRDSAFPKVNREFIWAPTCGSSAQRVTFSTSFLSPGEPDQGQLYITYGVGNQFFGGRPYHSASISVNGVELGRLGDIARFPRKVGWSLTLLKLPPRMLEAVHYGRNTVVIHV